MAENPESISREEQSAQPTIPEREMNEMVTWGDFLKLAERLRAQAPEEFEGFLEDRPKSPPLIRDLFEGWEE